MSEDEATVEVPAEETLQAQSMAAAWSATRQAVRKLALAEIAAEVARAERDETIRALDAAGIPRAVIARELGINRGWITQICQRETS